MVIFSSCCAIHSRHAAYGSRCPGGNVFHVLNSANGRLRLFEKDGNFLTFETLLAELAERFPMRILAWCLMSNHWHLVLWPRRDCFIQILSPSRGRRFFGTGLSALLLGPCVVVDPPTPAARCSPKQDCCSIAIGKPWPRPTPSCGSNASSGTGTRPPEKIGRKI
jgi:hypothetical protein